MASHTIRVIDFETTGMEPPAQVVEWAYSDLTGVDGVWTVSPPVARLCGVDAIPPEVRAVHHITMADVADCSHFDEAEVHNPDADVSVFAAHNLAFEDQFIPLRALPGICTLKAALRVWPDAPGHSNGVLRYWLEDQGLLTLNNDLAMPPHRAGPDAYVTAHILKALLEAGATARDMVAWTREPRVLPRNPIDGQLKEKGKPWSEVSHGLLVWMAGKPDMGDVQWNAQREIDRRRAA